MSAATICAADGCTNTIPDRSGQPGRPYQYCSPRCRPSHNRQRRARGPLVVDLDQPDPDSDTRHAGRSWTVRLRRGPDSVIIGRDLGRFSATALARDLQQLLGPKHEGGAIE